MDTVWVKPALLGAVVGSIATMALGFSQAGWVLGGTAERSAQQRSVAAVTEALVPVCISQSQSDPESSAKLGQLAGMKTSYERRDFVVKAGWATVPAAEKPNSELAAACAEALSKPAQT